MAFFMIAFFVFLYSPAYAEVIFHDAISLKNEPVMLKAETKGKVFSKGGEVVEFIVNGKSTGKSLSGGDGFAFKEFIPAKAGLYKISVISGKDRDEGFLLSLEKGTGIIFIDVEGSLYILSSKGPEKGSNKVIRSISKKIPVIYLRKGIIGKKTIKKWLKENEFIGAPIISWDNGDVFNEINKKGLKIRFIIGSPEVIESAKEFRPKAFSFVEVEGAEEVKDWEEIGKRMRLVIK